MINKKSNVKALARKYNTTIGNIKLLNNLSSNVILPGTILNIQSSDKITYIVKSNDNLKDIAKNFDIDINKLKRINNLQTTDILIGQVLLIPKNI